MPVQKRLVVAVAALAVIATAVAWRFGSRSVGGADSYGYFSQAEGWLAGDVPRHQPFVLALNDRPVTRWIFSPLGWKPSKTSADLVPIYAPGYPMILAAAKAAFGQTAMFWVVPLLTGVLVCATFLLGCQLGRPGGGVVAALLVTSSSTVLFMSMSPMSDVPSAAFWTLALAFVLGRTRRSAAAGGIAAAVAILVRPNLLPLAGFMGLWLLVNDLRAREHTAFKGSAREYFTRMLRGRAWLFALFAAGGALWVAWLNNSWYGSPGESGYGDLGGLFSAGHITANVARYIEWLFRAESPLAIAGLGVVLLAPVLLSRRRDVVGVPILLWAIVAWIWGMYLLYLVFDAWWYLRFLLPTFPIIALGVAGLLERAWAIDRTWRVAASAVVIATVVSTIRFSSENSVFTVGLTESRYPQIARAVASMSDAESAIITTQHSGSVRYYGGRMTVRWDVITPHEFGMLVRWLRAHGHHPFLLVDAPELSDIRARFAGDTELAELDFPPLASFFNKATVLYDLNASGPSSTTVLGTYTRKVMEPAAPAMWEK